MGKLRLIAAHQAVQPGSDEQEEASPDTVAVKDNNPG